MVGVLFVCMGNICRSPMAEGAFREAARNAGIEGRLKIDSAGTIGYHAGSPPDQRALAAARKQGVDISRQRSRKVTDDDFETFDYILVMDDENFRDITGRCPERHQARVQMFLRHAPHLPLDEMPDPYGGHRDDFDMCYSAAVDAAKGLLATIIAKHF